MISGKKHQNKNDFLLNINKNRRFVENRRRSKKTKTQKQKIFFIILLFFVKNVDNLTAREYNLIATEKVAIKSDQKAANARFII